MSEPIIPTAVRKVYEGRIFDVVVETITLPKGRTLNAEIVRHPGSVVIVPVTATGDVILVRQYRHGLRAVHHELPAGVCDAADSGPEQAARRELLEETGYGGGAWSLLSTLSANPGTHTNRTYTYLARGVTRMQEPQLEATEDLRVHLASPEEVEFLLQAGAIMQALHAAPLWQYLLMRQQTPPTP